MEGLAYERINKPKKNIYVYAPLEFLSLGELSSLFHSQERISGLSTASVIGIAVSVTVVLIVTFTILLRVNQKKMQQQYARNLAPNENFQVKIISNLVNI